MPHLFRILPRPSALLSSLPLSLLALALALAGQVIVTGRTWVWAGGVLLVAGAVLMGIVTLRARREHCCAGPLKDATATPPDTSPELPDKSPTLSVTDDLTASLIGGKTGLAALIFVTLVAAAFRFPLLGQLPPGLAPDEARVGLDVLELIRSSWSSAAWNGWPIFHLLTAGSVAVLGPSALTLRWPAALAGIAFAPAMYLLGRQIGGTRLGAIAGLLAAVLFWHADTTRGAWGYVAWGLTCEAIGLALLVRAARRPDPASMAVAGLALGLALQVSWGALAAVVTGAVVMLAGRVADGPPRRALASALAPFLLFFAVASGPVVVGMSVPDLHVATDADGDASARTPLGVLTSAIRLALMFNVGGDSSPLHGLHGEPVLDLLTGASLVLGIGIALARWRTGAYAGLVVWLLAALVSGALLARPGAPSSLLAIHALGPALLLAATALSSAGSGAFHRRVNASGWPLDLTLLMIGLIAAINAHALYVRRPADAATRVAYATAETRAAAEINEVASSHRIYLADVWLDHPTVRFLVREGTPLQRLDPGTTLPFREDESFAYFAPGSQEVVTEDLERLYEDGEIDRYRSPLDDEVVEVRSFRASAKVVAESRGVTLRATVRDRDRTIRYTLPAFRVEWPLTGEPARPTTLELFSAAFVETPGRYQLRLDGPPDAVLEVNGVSLAGPGRVVETALAGGTQRFRVVAPVDGAAHIEVQWLPPGASAFEPIPPSRLFREQRAASGLLALYRSGTDPTVPAEHAQVERHVQRRELPPALPRPYVVDWIGLVDAPKSGTYRFKLDASGPASLWIDDQALLLDDEANGTTVSMVLPDGDHRIQVRLVDQHGPTHADLAWAPPGEQFVAIPTSRFRPPDAPVDTPLPALSTTDRPLPPLGTPEIRWLASTEGEPRAVAVRADDAVYVTNVQARQVQQVVGGGRAIVALPASLAVPTDVEIGPNGQVWALDAFHGQIVRLDRDGNVELSIENRDLGLYRPRGLAIDRDGTILVADTGGSRVVRIAPDGTWLATIGPDIGGPEGIRQPTDVAVGPEGQLFVVNGEGGAVFRLSPQGKYERHWFVLPSDTERGARLAIGPDRSVWISEPDGRRISRFTFDGTPSGVVDQSQAGRLLRVPIGIAIGQDGTLYVADSSLRAVLAIGFQP